jgi:pyridoxal phosphate enzyme (YggS family)
MSSSSPPPLDLTSATLADRRDAILRAMAAACKRAARPPEAVTLIAVSKEQPDDGITACLATGQRVYGENRVQEAQARWRERRALDPDLRLHLIGPLQSNKAADAVALFDVIETLDRERLAGALAEAMVKQGRTPDLLVQVNTGEEPQKAGIAPRDLSAFLTILPERFGLHPRGLMCIPPAAEPPGLHFALLAKLAREHELSTLSMGMSGDYETAILFGATHVRVGSALFGERA